MSVSIGGVTYYAVDRAVVVDNDDNPVENHTGGLIYATIGGTPLALANSSRIPVAEVVTSPRGLTSNLYVAFPEAGPLEGWLDWGDDDIPPQKVTASTAEIAAWLAASNQSLDSLVILDWDPVAQEHPPRPAAAKRVRWETRPDELDVPFPQDAADRDRFLRATSTDEVVAQ